MRISQLISELFVAQLRKRDRDSRKTVLSLPQSRHCFFLFHVQLDVLCRAITPLGVQLFQRCCVITVVSEGYTALASTVTSKPTLHHRHASERPAAWPMLEASLGTTASQVLKRALVWECTHNLTSLGPAVQNFDALPHPFCFKFTAKTKTALTTTTTNKTTRIRYSSSPK